MEGGKRKDNSGSELSWTGSDQPKVTGPPVDAAPANGQSNNEQKHAHTEQNKQSSIGLDTRHCCTMPAGQVLLISE